MSKRLLIKFIQYIAVLFLIALAAKGTSLLDASASHPPLGLFYAVVVLSAWYGGIGPALVATVLALLSIHYSFMSVPGNYTESLVLLLIFGSVSVLISSLTVSRQRAERALRFQESNMLASLARIKDVILAVDGDWRITYMNRHFNGYEGHAISDLTGQILWEVYPRLSGTNFEKECRKAMAEGKPVYFEEKAAIPGKHFVVRLYPADDSLSILCIDIAKAQGVEQEEEELLTFSR